MDKSKIIAEIIEKLEMLDADALRASMPKPEMPAVEEEPVVAVEIEKKSFGPDELSDEEEISDEEFKRLMKA